jgi:hypothetical protein
MSTTIEPTIGRIVWYRDTDGATRTAIVVGVNGTFNLNLYVFGYSSSDRVGGFKDSVTHADPEHEPSCVPSWHWMPYQKQQAEKHANEVARADGSKMIGMAGAARQADTSDAAIEQEIQAKGKTAPRVTPADIEANIASEHYFTADEGVIGARWYAADSEEAMINLDDNIPNSLRLLTFCVLVLRNGFTVTGESACASPENFDAEIGSKIARQNAVQKIWPLMGYHLRDQLHNIATRPADNSGLPG